MSPESTLYEFGPFRLDPAERRLLRAGRPVPLTPKAFDTLHALVARSGRAISKDELVAGIWHDVSVQDATLAQNIFSVRKALGDAGAIETVPKFGYRFMLPVRTLTDTADRSSCWLKWGARRIPLVEGENIVGRDPDVEVALEATTVSRRHARITVSRTATVLQDLGSKNGTFVGGERLVAPSRIADGDRIGFGSLSVTFHDRPLLATTKTEVEGGG
jgi:DNA-binding winged helix-turn-helix (wHTH) protein